MCEKREAAPVAVKKWEKPKRMELYLFMWGAVQDNRYVLIFPNCKICSAYYVMV